MISPFLELLALARGEQTDGRALFALARRRAPEHDRGDPAWDFMQAQLEDVLTRPEWYVDQLCARNAELAQLVAGHVTPERLGRADHALRGYLRRAQERKQLDEFRSVATRSRLLARHLAERVSLGDLVVGHRDDGTVEHGTRSAGVDAAVVLAAGLGLVERALERACAGRTDTLAAADRDTYAQIRELALTDVTLDEVLSRQHDLGGASKLRATLIRRHGRLRERLASAVTAMGAGGELTEEQATLAHATLELFLNRRPTSGPRDVSSAEE